MCRKSPSFIDYGDLVSMTIILRLFLHVYNNAHTEYECWPVGPHDSYEWGDVSLSDIKEYEYHPIEWDTQKSSSYPSKQSKQSTLAASLNVASYELNSIENQRQQSILMLGCGNSKLGEEMVKEGGFKGPVVQVDVSNNVVENMRQRCSDLVSEGSMNFVQDDATELSAFRDGMVDACLDKGLLDAIFCAEGTCKKKRLMILFRNSIARCPSPTNLIS